MNWRRRYRILGTADGENQQEKERMLATVRVLALIIKSGLPEKIQK
jgi:hypothetical protein